MLVTGDGMAATWLRPIHINRGKSIAQTIFLRTSYAQNPDKVVNKPISKNDNTEEKPITSIISDSTAYIKDSNKTLDGELVKCFECDPHTVDEEFLIAKKEYEYLTARDQGKRNILAYHIRQSFLPGEIEPEKALEVGYETGLRFTRGKHSMIVAVHTDKAHIHCHIVFNSTRLDCRGKFNNFKNSSFALQRLSDIICLEHGLSVIENPQPSKGKNYAKWLGKKEPSWQQKLRDKIDEVLPGCATFEDFMQRGVVIHFCKTYPFRNIKAIPHKQLPPPHLSYFQNSSDEQLDNRNALDYMLLNQAAFFLLPITFDVTLSKCQAVCGL